MTIPLFLAAGLLAVPLGSTASADNVAAPSGKAVLYEKRDWTGPSEYSQPSQPGKETITAFTAQAAWNDTTKYTIGLFGNSQCSGTAKFTITKGNYKKFDDDFTVKCIEYTGIPGPGD
ncbi:hypothetical protein [Streptomyces sp. NPDC052496]|uniref:hypothetical protein n=1 Tax=Streptomyces sp. NPDC052496 TaxID=3154951 RepID=UPI00343AB6AB